MLKTLTAALAAAMVCDRGLLGVASEPAADWLCDTLDRELKTEGRVTGRRQLYKSPHLSRNRLTRALASIDGYLNTRVIPAESIEYSTAEQSIDLEPEVATERVDFVLSGQITAAGGNNDGAAFADAIQRLIPRLRIKLDNFTLVDSDLRGLYVNYQANVPSLPSNTVPLDDPDSATTFDFRLPFSYHFVSPFTARPYDTHLPPLPVRNALKVIVNFATSTQSAGSDPGTGAMLSAGTDTYTFSETPTLEIVQVTSPAQGIKPQYVPVFESFDLREFSGAVSRHVGKFDNDRRFSRLILRATYGGTDLLQDAISNLTLRATGQTWYDEVPGDTLRDESDSVYPSLRDFTFAVTGPKTQSAALTGYQVLTFLNGGLLGGAVNPREHTDLQLVLNLAAPTSGDGLIRVYQNQLVEVANFTAVQGRGQAAAPA